MPAFIAHWPDSTISVLSYPGGHDESTYESWLFEDLDEEANPLDAKVYKLPNGYHLQTETAIQKHKSTNEMRAALVVTSFHSDGKRLKKMTWSPDICFRYWTRIRMESRRLAAEKDADVGVHSSREHGPDYPPVPEPCFTIEQVRTMNSFSGIYIAINAATGNVQYVGKSRDVTKRVSSSREELFGCLLAIIKMPENEIHFAELHYISKLRPTMNKCGQR